MNAIDKLNDIVKALELGNYNAAPSQLVQGAALQTENLSNMLQLLTFDQGHLKLQKALKVESCKSQLFQFVRQLSYGVFGGSAQLEGNVGQEETSDYVRIAVPMTYYSHFRRVTIASMEADSVDGRKSDERAAADAALKLSGDIEFHLFRGKADFTDPSGVGRFTGHPASIPAYPAEMHGLDLQVRQSDSQKNAQDLMFNEYGSSDSVVIAGGGGGANTLTQDNVEDAAVRSAMNMGSADRLLVDPKVMSAYNKISFGKERIVLAGAPQDATGADLRRQWTSGGVVQVEASRFLSGKTNPAGRRVNGPAAPSIATASATEASFPTSFLIGQVYLYQVSAVNEIGESPLSASSSVTIAASGDVVNVTITPPASTVRYFNVYRSTAGGSVLKYIGRVMAAGQSPTTTAFKDLNNKVPGFVTGFLVQGDTMSIQELAPFTRLKLAVTDLSHPEAYYRFCCLAVYQPRKNVILDNLLGSNN